MQTLPEVAPPGSSSRLGHTLKAKKDRQRLSGQPSPWLTSLTSQKRARVQGSNLRASLFTLPFSRGPQPEDSALYSITPPKEHILIFGQGRFQRLVMLCTMLVVFTSIVHALASSDLAPPVEHWCRAPAAYSNLPLETWKNASVPAFHAAGELQSHCFRYEPPFPVQGDPEADNRTLVPCDAGWDYEPGAAERSIVSAWNLVCGRRWMLSLLTAGYMAGGVLGGAGAGILADRIGRRPVLCLLIFVLILTGFATAFAQSMQVFAALRFVLSTATSSTLVTSIVLLYEVNDIDHRALFCALSVSGAGVTSAIYRALVVAFIRNREMAQIAYMVPTSALVVALYLMEESPRWLLATARVRQAEGVMQWAAYVNKVEKGDFKTRLTALRHEIRRQQEQLEHGVASDFDAIISDRGTSRCFSSNRLRIIALLLEKCSALV
ncbi:hypothetical protein HPB48_013304 [Haemaphysalis longicornis]|uniref:Major facilitator superfamily (MFS) profile domain-containing protein n=1 Tax=Haemaphysalis longicornis TaxID=44386 RepID=A0A9J6GQ45_HAELO|nr:hypothetical protein HPB48_013304 [Haemaphysalis longicornis]